MEIDPDYLVQKINENKIIELILNYSDLFINPVHIQEFGQTLIHITHGTTEWTKLLDNQKTFSIIK